MSIQKLYIVGGNLATLYNNTTALSMNWIDPYNPMDLPDKTFRLKYKPSTVPTPYEGVIHPIGVTASLYDADENIWDVTTYDTLDYLMANDTNLIAILGGNLSSVSILNGSFSGCTALTSTIALPYIVGASNTFTNCSSLSSITTSGFNNVVSANYMFSNCGDLSTIPENSFNRVENADYMFYDCRNLTSNAIDFITSHPNITSHQGCFYGCTAMSDYAQATAQYPTWF